MTGVEETARRQLLGVAVDGLFWVKNHGPRRGFCAGVHVDVGCVCGCVVCMWMGGWWCVELVWGWVVVELVHSLSVTVTQGDTSYFTGM